MKNIISKIMLPAIVLASMLSSCSEDAYEEKFADPSKSSTVDFGNLMVGTNLFSREYAMSTYGRFFGWESQNLMKQANTVGLSLDPNVFYKIEGYTDGMPPLSELAKEIGSYRFMESLYADMDEAAKAENKVYLLAAETQLYAFTLYILPIYGDIPFDEVGQVSVTGDVSLAHPHYQDDKDIFKKVLDRLGEMDAEWAAIKDAPAAFKSLDFINKGDLDKWRRYNNSIRLKGALVVATQGELASYGQGIIKEILENPTKYPIVEKAEQNIVMAQVAISGSVLDINGGSGFDWVNQRIAGTEIINRMQAAGDGGQWSGAVKKATVTYTGPTALTDDPRLPIMFNLATVNGEFAVMQDTAAKADASTPKNGKAVPSVFRGSCASMDAETWAEYLYPSVNRAYFSYIRENGFFKSNRNWDNPIITSAEMNFIKAEAFQHGWASGVAKDAFKKGVTESIKLYFKYQKNRTETEDTYTTGSSSTSVSFKCVLNPDDTKYDDAWCDAFAETRWTKNIKGDSYGGGEIEAIMEQKWLHYGYMYANEQWTDLRRTGYPRMTYLKDTDAYAEVPYPKNRNRYPESERNNNKNFQDEVGSQDNVSDVLFWAIPDGDWHDGPHY